VELGHPRVKKIEPKVIQEPVADLGAMKMFIFQDHYDNVIEISL